MMMMMRTTKSHHLQLPLPIARVPAAGVLPNKRHAGVSWTAVIARMRRAPKQPASLIIDVRGGAAPDAPRVSSSAQWPRSRAARKATGKRRKMRAALRRTIVLLLEMTFFTNLLLLLYSLEYMNFLYKLYGPGTYISSSFTFPSLHFSL